MALLSWEEIPMLSMTGYGRAMLEREGRQLTIELKSVNHRFLDLSFRMPRNLMFLEDDIRKCISSRLARGHVDVFMTYRNMRSDARVVNVDRALYDAYAAALSQLAGEDCVRDDRSLMSIARMPDVLTVSEAEEDQEALRTLLKETLSAALDGLVAMREREGAEMKRDLSLRLDRIENMLGRVEERYPQTVEEYTRRLRSGIEELIGQSVDEARLLTEVAIMVDRSAIAEETVRLHAHIAQFRECLEQAEPVGRRIDFLVQELNREVNTITSKSQDVPITQLAVDMKAEIEKLREQLQNIE